jgi:hypothetical protein
MMMMMMMMMMIMIMMITLQTISSTFFKYVEYKPQISCSELPLGHGFKS